MTNTYLTVRRNLTKRHANVLNFFMFLTGALIGCLLVRFCEIESILFSEGSQSALTGSRSLAVSFSSVLLANGKFLILLYLFAFLRCGAALVPPLFGAEGAFLGAAAASVVAAMGNRGVLLLAILLIFRLVLVIPYGFVLGAWSVARSLDFASGTGADRQSCFQVLLVTLLVLALASFLECTLARWFGGIYFLKFGV